MNILRLFRKRRQPSPERIVTAKRTEVAISGSGGQGIILAGKILAESVSIYDGKEAVMTQSYGPEARGGASKAEIVISDAPILYPKVIKVNILLCMTQQSMDKYSRMLDPDGLLIVNETFVKNVPEVFKNVFKAPFTMMAMKILGNQLVANVIALGALVAITKIVSRKSLIRAVLDKVPRKVLVVDRVAVDTGFKVVEDSGYVWNKEAV